MSIAASAAPIRVLVADDNEDHLFLIVRALRSTEGVVLEVEGVRDGEEVLRHLYREGEHSQKPRPHLILLDLKMPRLNGLEVLERVKSDDELREIPIVVLSSSDRPEDVSGAYRLGSNSYVTKPSTISGLRTDLERLSEYWTQLATLPEVD